eukprot:Opistho-1_new@98501
MVSRKAGVISRLRAIVCTRPAVAMMRKASAVTAITAKAPISARVSRRARITKTTNEKIWSDRKRVIVQPIELRLRARNPSSKRAGRLALKQASRFQHPHACAFESAPGLLPDRMIERICLRPEARISNVRDDRGFEDRRGIEREIGQAVRPRPVHLVIDRAADGAAMIGEALRAFERDRIALRAIGEADQLDDRARMLEEVAPHDALPCRPLGVEPEVIDALGVKIGARERFEIGPVDHRIVFEDDRLPHAARDHVLPDREVAGIAADLALAHRPAFVAADRGLVDRHPRRRTGAGIEETPRKRGVCRARGKGRAARRG